MSRIEILRTLFKERRHLPPLDSLSEVELVLGIIADDQDTTREWIELYRGWILGDNTHDPFNVILKLYTDEKI